MDEPDQPRTLGDFPYVTVRIGCMDCRRRGSYRLAFLAERFGAGASLELVLYRITRRCPWQVPPLTKRRKYVRYCRAHFADLVHPGPPDEPPTHPEPAASGPPRLRLVG